MRSDLNHHEDDLLMRGSSSPSSFSSPSTNNDNSMAALAQPLDFPNPAETSALLAKEMNDLSIEEREKVLEDVHGVARVVDEPPEFVSSRLLLLEQELAKLPMHSCYNLAQSLDKQYIESDKLRLLFLRATSFEPYPAACRMESFLEQKLELFGREKLTRTIAYDDLDPDDVETLEHGMFQQLGERDHAGRKIIAMFPKLKVAKAHNNALRAYYYVVMRSMTDDENAQKRGVVGLVYAIGGFNMDLALIRKIAKLRNALPLRFDSIHACYDVSQLLPLVSLGMMIMGARSRMRFRSHYGSQEECQDQLKPFGIPTLSAVPALLLRGDGTSTRGEFNLEHHCQFLKMHRELEAARKKAEEDSATQTKKRAAHTKSSSDAPGAVSSLSFAGISMGNTSRDGPRDHPISLEAAPPPPLAAGAPDTTSTTTSASSWYGAAMGLNFEHFNFMSRASRPTLPNPWCIGSGGPPQQFGLPQQQQAPAAFGSIAVSRGSSSFTPNTQNLYRTAAAAAAGGSVLSVDPQMKDVLFGRGKPIQDRPGNVRFREILELHRQQYDQGEKSGKTVIAADIVRIVKGEGGRFLKQNDHGLPGWVEVDDASARMKVSHAFRTRRSVLIAAKARKMSDR